jgi:Fic family protein
MISFTPRFTITNRITTVLTTIERARGFLEAATLSEDWVRRTSQRALLLEAHHTTHIEGTQLSIEQAEALWAGRDVSGADADDVRELLNYRQAFDLVGEYLATQLQEVKMKGEQAIRADVIAAGKKLNARQASLVAVFLEQTKLSLADCQKLLPDVARRTLQRDLRRLVEARLIAEVSQGPTDPTRHYRWLGGPAMTRSCDKL